MVQGERGEGVIEGKWELRRKRGSEGGGKGVGEGEKFVFLVKKL